MITFFVSLALLVLGYATYGRFVEHVFGPDERPTPAVERADGVDYVEMPTWKVFLIQLLNIAGTGPIFGALMGAVFGPVVFLWIVFGSILGGAVHDYMTGMISCRMGGASVSEIVGIHLGNSMKQVMRVFSVILLVLVGTVFVTSPAALLAMLTPETFNAAFWVTVILCYYLLATLLPIDKLIGKIYPVFGIVLILMVIGVGGGLLVNGYCIPELTLQNLHPSGKPVWPYMFVTVACGAVSGFHATQSPMMARCIKSERDGRRVFYGAMISEGAIALIWAAAGVAFYGSTGGLQEALSSMGQSGVVYDISTSLLGVVGGALAVVGVVACPITSGDTAFRSARLTLSDWFQIDQGKIGKRLLLTAPLLASGACLTQLDFDVVWRYFSWSNQTLAMIALWAAAVYLKKNKGCKASLIAAVPAAFMSAVSSTYILMAQEGFQLSAGISYLAGIGFAAMCLCIFLSWAMCGNKKVLTPSGAVVLAAVCVIGGMFLGNAGNGAPLSAESALTMEQIYKAAVEDAVSADENEIYPLVTLKEEDGMVSVQNGNVLLLTVNDSPEQYPAGETLTLPGEVWTFTDQEIEKWYPKHKDGVRDWTLRLEQLVGVPPDAGYTHVTAMWVSPEDVIRPAYLTDVTEDEMTVSLPEKTSEEYRDWFNGNILWSYFDSAYPWTRMGYTYDWAPDSGEYGLTEFLVRQGAEVTVEYTDTIAEFINRMGQAEK